MERNADPNLKPESESRPASQTGSDFFDFEFPTALSGSASPNDVVFCGKVINRETQPVGKIKNPFVLLRSGSSAGRSNRITEPVRTGSIRENRWQRSDSSSRKHRHGLFGMVKFPLQMELSDIKMRQERREPMRLPMPTLTAEGDVESVSGGGGSCWELVRPLRRRSLLMNALTKATFGCIPAV